MGLHDCSVDGVCCDCLSCRSARPGQAGESLCWLPVMLVQPRSICQHSPKAMAGFETSSHAVGAPACRPSWLVMLAIDGVAPQAKMKQQRTRRFLSAFTAALSLKYEAEVNSMRATFVHSNTWQTYLQGLTCSACFIWSASSSWQWNDGLNSRGVSS